MQTDDISKALETIQRAENAKAEAQRELEASQAAFDSLALAVADGIPGAADKKEKAYKAVHKAQQSIAEAEAVLRGAKARHGAAIESKRQLDIARALKTVEAASLVAVALAAEIEMETVAVVRKLCKLQQVAIQMHNDAPIDGKNLNDSKLAPLQLERNFRIQLRKLQLKWAHSVFGSDQDLPSFTSSFNDAVRMLLQKCPKVQGAAVAELPK